MIKNGLLTLFGWRSKCLRRLLRPSALVGVVTNKYRMCFCLWDVTMLFNIFRVVAACRFVGDNTNKGKATPNRTDNTYTLIQ